MSQNSFSDMKKLIIIKAIVIIFIFSLVLLYHNHLPPAFTFLVLLANSLFTIGLIGEYGLYVFLKKWRKKLDEKYEEYEKMRRLEK